MSREGKFLIFCMEQYKSAKKLTGKEVAALFRTFGVFDYVVSCFEALHTTGTNYIIDDIDQFISTRRIAAGK